MDSRKTSRRPDRDSPYLAYSNSTRTRARLEGVNSGNMAYDCGSCLVKYTLCGFNFVIFILSTVILGVGIWLLTDMNSLISLVKVVPHNDAQVAASSPLFLQTGAFALIAIGAAMFFISFLGYCGALKESRCLLTLYGILLIAVLIAEVTMVIMGVVLKSTIEIEVKNVMKLSIERYYNTTDNPIALGWNELQKRHNCCGVDGGADYQRNPTWQQQTTWIVPESCCAFGSDRKPLDSNCMTSPTPTNSFYDQGCYDQLKALLRRNLDTAVIVLVVLGLVELLEILFAFCLAKSINKFDK